MEESSRRRLGEHLHPTVHERSKGHRQLAVGVTEQLLGGPEGCEVLAGQSTVMITIGWILDHGVHGRHLLELVGRLLVPGHARPGTWVSAWIWESYCMRARK